MSKRVSWALVAALAAAFAWFVWPTRYRYFAMSLDSRTPTTARENRFTGELEALYPRGQGWYKIDRPR